MNFTGSTFYYSAEMMARGSERMIKQWVPHFSKRKKWGERSALQLIHGVVTVSVATGVDVTVPPVGFG
jgi:hypothetical protein